MIPTIEQIIEDLITGTISKSQAITWLNAHAAGAVNELRDHFAAQAVNSLMSAPEINDLYAAVESQDGIEKIKIMTCKNAYQWADAMLKARNE